MLFVGRALYICLGVCVDLGVRSALGRGACSLYVFGDVGGVGCRVVFWVGSSPAVGVGLLLRM